ncbi:MAG: hypothetical protein NC402_05325 [Prevotella sp.]|nr:hypothetical protein [Prevotella sp.]MCM1075504.1 hypothetical protein [Ruminococcus sp.]
MSVFLIILAVALYAVSGLLLYRKEVLGPVASFLALGTVYLSEALPMNMNMLITWLCLTLVVTGVSAMQEPAVMSQRRGMGYIMAGAVVGLAVGLMGYTFTTEVSAVYAVMVLAVVAGIFFGYLLFTRTPDGEQLRRSRSRFFSYLLAKGFPVAIAVMMLGVPLILWLFTYINTELSNL